MFLVVGIQKTYTISPYLNGKKKYYFIIYYSMYATLYILSIQSYRPYTAYLGIIFS